MTTPIVPSPDCPRSLKRLYRRLGSFQKVADFLGVNVAPIHAAYTTGQAPANTTTARKLGFDPKRPRSGDGRTRHMRWWHHLKPRQRDQLVDFVYHYHGADSTATDQPPK